MPKIKPLTNDGIIESRVTQNIKLVKLTLGKTRKDMADMCRISNAAFGYKCSSNGWTLSELAHISNELKIPIELLVGKTSSLVEALERR